VKPTLRRRRRGGFTLIELLVVVGIIAILASLLLPTLGNVREKARQTNCMSNLTEIGKALLMYTDDFNGYMPAGSNVANVLYNASDLGGIGDYLNVPGSYRYPTGSRRDDAPPLARCPNGGTDGTKNACRRTANPLDGNPNFSYSMNCRIWVTATVNLKIWTVSTPSTRMMVGDCGIDGWNCTVVVHAGAMSGKGHVAFRHGTSADFGFVDGHVENRQYGNVPQYNSLTTDPQRFWANY